MDGGFEGPEKRLELRFRPSRSTPEGLRSLTRAQLDELCGQVNCTILSSLSSDDLDSYVLSESSLFVYRERLVLKTCGTTTLLRCLPTLLSHAQALDMAVTYVCYSRRNFLFPDRQLYPHCSFENEIAILNAQFDGHAFILGPVTGVHWHLYVADMRTEEDSARGPQQTFEMMMTGLDPAKMRQFYRVASADVVAVPALKEDRNGAALAKPITKSSGLAALFAGADTDEFLFDPCGYSMNGVRGAEYATVHVTPEPECSFVSYETNEVRVEYPTLISALAAAFQPSQFTVVVLADAHAKWRPAAGALTVPGYRASFRTSYDLECEQSVRAVSFYKERDAAC